VISKVKTDKSVPRGGGCNAIFPTLKHGATPNRTYPSYACRNNPPIHWRDTNTPTSPQKNRFNGLHKKHIKQKYEKVL